MDERQNNNLEKLARILLASYMDDHCVVSRFIQTGKLGCWTAVHIAQQIRISVPVNYCVGRTHLECLGCSLFAIAYKI